MSRDALLGSTARKVEPVDTPAGQFFVRTLTAGEKDRLDRFIQKGQFRSRMLLAACCSEDGRSYFTEQDIPALDQVTMDVVEPIVDAAIRLNRMMPEQAEDLRKNSPSRETDSSTD